MHVVPRPLGSPYPHWPSYLSWPLGSRPLLCGGPPLNPSLLPEINGSASIILQFVMYYWILMIKTIYLLFKSYIFLRAKQPFQITLFVHKCPSAVNPIWNTAHWTPIAPGSTCSILTWFLLASICPRNPRPAPRGGGLPASPPPPRYARLPGSPDLAGDRAGLISPRNGTRVLDRVTLLLMPAGRCLLTSNYANLSFYHILYFVTLSSFIYFLPSFLLPSLSPFRCYFFKSPIPHLLTPLLTYLLTHSLTSLLTYYLTHWLTDSFNNLGLSLISRSKSDLGALVLK